MSNTAEDLTHRTIDAATVRDAARGRWDSILPALGVPAEYLRDRHGPCPGCGGEDRFRYDDSERGGFICGRGGDDPLAGDGFTLLEHVHGWSFSEALAAVAGELGLGSKVEPPTPEELEQRRQEQAERRRKEEEREQRKRAEAANKASKLWRAAFPATPANPYLARKGVQPVPTLRELEADAAAEILGYTPKFNGEPLEGLLLVAPVKVAGELTTVELIDGPGRKHALRKGVKGGGWWATGSLDESPTILIGEGVATVLSAAKASGHPGVAGLASNNLPKVAEALRSQYPEAALIVLADLDKSTEEPDPGAVEAARQAAGSLALPDFGGERPEGAKDFNDLHQAHGPEAVAEALENAAPPIPEEATGTEAGESVPPWRSAETPPGWRISRKGVCQESEDGSEDWVALAPVWVQALTRNPQGGGWGGVVRWLDRDGHQQERAIPFSRFHEQGNTLAQELADDGLAVIPGKERKLAQFLGSCWPGARVRSMDRLGWIDDAAGSLTYVQPHRVITAGGDEEVVYQPERYSPTARTIHAAGTLAEWQEHVATPCHGNPALIFAICAGLAAPLLRAAELESGGFHLYGTTTSGKTTWLQIAASVFGCGADPAQTPDTAFIRRWNATGNAVEGLAAAHNDAPLCLDEIGTCSARDFGGLVYNVAGGQGRAAMSQNRNLKAPRSWRTLLLSTGELSTAAKIAEGGKEAKGGQLVRIADLALDPILADTHGEPVAEFGDRLKRACGRYYGTAGPALVEYLVGQSDDAFDLRNTVSALLDRAAQRLTPDNIPAEQRRVLRRFGLVLVAGWLARRAGLVPFEDEEVEQAVRVVVDQWLASAETQSEAERGVEAIRAFILRHGARFQAKNASQEVRERVGYHDEGNALYLFTPEGFREACGGHNQKTVANELDRRGFLYKNDASRLRSLHSVGGKRPRFYAVREQILNDDSQPEHPEQPERSQA